MLLIHHKQTIHDIVPRRYDASLCDKISRLVQSVDGLTGQHAFMEKVIAIKDAVTKKIHAIEPKHSNVIGEFLNSLTKKTSVSYKNIVYRTKRSTLEVMNFERIAMRTEERLERKELMMNMLHQCGEGGLKWCSAFFEKNMVRPFREVISADVWERFYVRCKDMVRSGYNFHARNSAVALLRGTRTIGVFFLVFTSVYLFANIEALTTISGRYLKTDSVLAPYLQEREKQANFLDASRLGEASEELKVAQYESEQLQNKKSFLPLALEVLPDDNRIFIPKIGKNIPLNEVSDESIVVSADSQSIEDAIQEALKAGVVRYPGTAKPGQLGNVFVTGHSSYYLWAPGNFKDVFALLHQVEVGDDLIVYYSDIPGSQRKYTYRVGEIKEVKPSEVDVLRQTDDFRLTLMTCTPIGTNLRRLIITAFLVKTDTLLR